MVLVSGSTGPYARETKSDVIMIFLDWYCAICVKYWENDVEQKEIGRVKSKYGKDFNTNVLWAVGSWIDKLSSFEFIEAFQKEIDADLIQRAFLVK